MQTHVSNQPGASASPIPSAQQVTLWLAVMTAATVAAFLLWRNDPAVTAENHILESSQFGLLMFACLGHAMRARRSTHPFDTLCRVGLALLCLSFAVRELDIDKFGEAAAWSVLEGVVRGLVIAGWIAFGIFALPRLTLLRTHAKAALVSGCALFTIAGGMLYALSFPLDKEMLPLAANTAQFVEETLQLNATLLLFAATTMRIITLPPTETPPEAASTETSAQTETPSAEQTSL